MSLRNRLAAIFSPTRRLAGPEPATVRGGGALGGVQRVVPRAECHYRRVDLSGLPARQRAAAARIAARRHEPRPQASFHTAWNGGIAHVWTWIVSAGEGADPGEAEWIPESLLRAPPGEDGVRLLQQVAGVEGQCWRGGVLQASQWWAAPPTGAEWLRFVRGCGYGAEQAEPMPQPQALGWSEPWGDRPRGLPASPRVLERWAWTGCIAIVALALGWQVAASIEWSLAQHRLDARMAALRARATPLLSARERAERARDALLGLRDLQAGIDDYRLMAEVASPLPKDARLVGWQREDTRLLVTVKSTDLDPRHFVSAYDGNPLLSNVIATPAEGAMGLAFDLAPANPVPGAAPAGGGAATPGAEATQ
jgi:hypothetical protein